MSEMVILLLHGGNDHVESKIILDYLDGKSHKGLQLIYIANDHIKNQIKNNKYDIEIEYIPSIVMMKNNIRNVYKADLETVKQIVYKLKKLTYNTLYK